MSRGFSLLQPDGPQQDGKARVGAQMVESRLDFQVNQKRAALFQRLLQKRERLIFLVESAVPSGDVERRDIMLLRLGTRQFHAPSQVALPARACESLFQRL